MPRISSSYGRPYATLSPVTRRQVLVQLDDALVDELDARARRAGVSRSELIRRAIAGYLAKDAASRTRALAGGFPVTDVSAEMRRRDRHP